MLAVLHRDSLQKYDFPSNPSCFSMCSRHPPHKSTVVEHAELYISVAGEGETDSSDSTYQLQ